MQNPHGGYWPYPGGPPLPPPGGYPGYPPQGSGAPTALNTETPDGKSTNQDTDDKKENGVSKKEGETATNAQANGDASETPAKDGEEKKEAKEKSTTEGNTGATPTPHKSAMMPPVPMPGYPHFSPDPAHHPHAHMPPPPPYPGYPYAHPHYPPPPHPHFWGPPPVRPPMPRSSDRYQSDVDGREGATSPSQIQTSHRDEVQHMGCTCKKTRCLKLYCQCFGVKLYCGSNCRCLQCYNVEQHEKFRQEAMRLILSRNPSAFDTKFKKGPQEDKPEAKQLAHKLGCKCRKSACMKKYCECYAANVKCSSNCRCMGCKNMGNTYYEPGAGGMGMDMKPYGEMPVFPVPHLHPGQVMQSAARAAAATRKAEPPIQAAQNLAFLKHGSPEKSGSDKENPDESVNSLMMAAYAMTEFGQGSSPSKSRYESKKREAEPSSVKKETGDDEEEETTKKVKIED